MNKECRELIDKIYQDKLWVEPREIDHKQELEEIIRNMEDSFWVRELQEMIEPSPAFFTIVKKFRTAIAADKYLEKLKVLRRSTEVKVDMAWCNIETSGCGFLGPTMVVGPYLVLQFLRDDAKFMFEVWEPWMMYRRNQFTESMIKQGRVTAEECVGPGVHSWNIVKPDNLL